MEIGQRKLIIGGNWKCNGNLESIKTLTNDVLNNAQFDSAKVDVVVAPISLHVSTVKALLNPSVRVACQNMSATGTGAFTGEVSGEQLKDFDIEWVIIGHSERRTLFGETDEMVAAKVTKAQALGLYAMVCIGESLEVREAGTTNEFLKSQLDAIKGSISDWSRIVIAYEPIWAIGTGKTATPEIAESTCGYVRSWITDNISAEVGQATRIQYGGSVGAKNAAELISQENIDGFLVGGAALKPDFLQIITAANNFPESSA
jgi:triosephosphate isomerase